MNGKILVWVLIGFFGIAVLVIGQGNPVQIRSTGLPATTPLYVRQSDGTAAVSDAAIGATLSSNPVPVACHNETTPTVIANTQAGVPECDTNQRLIVVSPTAGNFLSSVNLRDGAGSNVILGTGGLPVGATILTTTTGGYTNYSPTIGASDNHAVIKNGAGTVGYIIAFNNSASVNYMRLYNAGTGFNGCNSATNLIARFQIPASTSVAGFIIPLPAQGMGGFSTGISMCVTSLFGDTDTTAATASAISLNVGFN